MEKKFEKYLGSLTIPFKKSKAEAWKEVYSKTVDNGEVVKIIPISGPFYLRTSFWVGAAASLALLLSVGYLLNLSTPVEFATEKGEIEYIDLPDGSLAILNAGSTLSFNEDEWTESRNVTLSGEAFFNVQKGKEFLVKTDNGNVQVLGTSFNVFSREDDFNVSCKTGKVRVSNVTDEVVLTPGLSTYTLNGILVEAHEFNSDLVGIWKQREYYHFENVPLRDVFAELERQFSVTFELSGIPENIVVNADINIQELDKALNVVCATFGLSADKSNHSVYKISKN